MKRRIAVADLGTNTFNLLIAEISDKKPRRLYSEEIPVKLGEGSISSGLIAPEAWLRGLTAIKYIQQKASEYQCSNIKAVATAAIRSTKNGNDFTYAVKAETGIDIEIITGNREAELIYEGVRLGTNIVAPSLIMDIGGGSVEFILCNQDKIHWKNSYPVGTTRIKEQFHLSDPVTQADIQLIEQYLDKCLAELFDQCAMYKPQCLIGSAGAFETFASLACIRYKLPYDKDQSEFTFRMEQFLEITSSILASDRPQRTNMPGLVSFRIDTIVPATVLTQYILSCTGINSLALSSYALKEGVLANALHNE